VKEIAEEKGMNITDLQLLANRITNARLTYATVHALWHNKTKRPDLDTLAAVARALDVEPGDLIMAEAAELREQPSNKRMPALAVAF
jgi:DNA-binding Xre family transcriptional regulator